LFVCVLQNQKEVLYLSNQNEQFKPIQAMNTSTANIKETLTYKFVSDEARELSWKLQTTIYVIQKGNSLFTTLSIEEGIILSSWKLGNETQY
jgi:hypothetical protein